MLQDIAVLTGGQVITEDMGLKLDKTELNQLGKARKVVENPAIQVMKPKTICVQQSSFLLPELSSQLDPRQPLYGLALAMR